MGLTISESTLEQAELLNIEANQALAAGVNGGVISGHWGGAKVGHLVSRLGA